MEAFFSKFKHIASKETRVVTLPRPMMGVPAGGYAFVEFYCSEEECDCRRAVIQVWPEGKPGVVLATINYGWESEAFYRDWAHGDAEIASDLHGISLMPMAKQSRIAEPLLALVRSVIEEDPSYEERLRRHYQLFKAAVKKETKGASRGRRRLERRRRKG